jgi:hypothetical protein
MKALQNLVIAKSFCLFLILYKELFFIKNLKILYLILKTEFLFLIKKIRFIFLQNEILIHNIVLF